MNPDPQVKLYAPSPDEPSVFSQDPTGIPIEWPSWFRHRQVMGRGKIMAYEIRSPSQEIVGVAVQLRLRLREELAAIDVELPAEPPSLYAKGTSYISLAWVLDTARRERMSPEEAMGLGMALRRM